MRCEARPSIRPALPPLVLAAWVNDPASLRTRDSRRDIHQTPDSAVSAARLHTPRSTTPWRNP